MNKHIKLYISSTLKREFVNDRCTPEQQRSIHNTLIESLSVVATTNDFAEYLVLRKENVLNALSSARIPKSSCDGLYKGVRKKGQENFYSCAKINAAIPQTPPEATYTIIPTNRGQVRIHAEHGAAEAEENISIAKYLAENNGYEIDLLPNLNNKKSADTLNRTLGYEQEYKTNRKPTKSSIDNLLRAAAKQASHIVLMIKSDINLVTLARGIKGRVLHAEIEEILLIQNGKELILSREQIIKKGFKIQPEDFA